MGIIKKIFGKREEVEESPCDRCRKRNECVDYMQYGKMLACNDPRR